MNPTLLSFAVLFLVAVGCSDADTPKVPARAPDAGHGHAAPHGGAIFDYGGHDGHVEVLRDGGTGTLTVHLYDDAMQPVAVAAPMTLGVSGPQGSRVVELSAVEAKDGQSTVWRASDPAWRDGPVRGRLRFARGGETFQVDITTR